MFGKPQWFATKSDRSWPVPRTWQGWAYLLLGAGVIVAPAGVLAARGQWIEAILWSLIAGVFGVLELRQLRRDCRAVSEFDQLFRIDGDGNDASVFSERYKLMPPKR